MESFSLYKHMGIGSISGCLEGTTLIVTWMLPNEQSVLTLLFSYKTQCRVEGDDDSVGKLIAWQA